MTITTATYRVCLSDHRAPPPRRTNADRTPHAPPRSRTHPTARLLALAHLVDRAVLGGHVRDYSAAAVVVGLSQPRLTSVMGLLFLSPRIQERILTGDLVISDNRLRPLLHSPLWSEQERCLDA